MKLTLVQYLHGTITGYYPGENRPDRPLDEDEVRILATQRRAAFCILGSTTRVEVHAISLIEEPEGVVGMFEDKEGQSFAGTWNPKAQAFIGMRLPARGIPPVEVEYSSPVKAWPTAATSRQCESWTDEGRPIFLSGGLPIRHISRSNASLYTWRALHDSNDSSAGWVQDSD